MDILLRFIYSKKYYFIEVKSFSAISTPISLKKIYYHLIPIQFSKQDYFNKYNSIFLLLTL